MMTLIPLVVLLLSLPLETVTSGASIRPARLRCENRVDPIGIDVERPRLSWVLEAIDPEARGLVQTAYRIQVAGTPEALEAGGDLHWDSGLVESSETDQIEFAPEGVQVDSGRVERLLEPGAQYFWRVRVRDGEGELSPWSEPATWSMGLTSAGAWKASWIGHDSARELADLRPTLRGASWIRFPEPNAEASPAEKRAFRLAFELPAGAAIEEATMLVTADDLLELWVNGRHAFADDSPTPTWKRPACLRLDRRLVPGRNVVAIETANLAEGPTACIARMEVRLESGESVLVATGADWRCAARPAEGWQAPAFDDSGWAAAEVVGAFGVEPWGDFTTGAPTLPPPRYLRRSFEVERPVRRAVVYASGLGLVDLRLNGAEVGDTFFDPGWTDYARRVYYRAFDVTSMLRPGENALGAILGDGWYSGYVGYKPERDHYGRDLRLLAQLHLEYEDGTQEVIASDGSWRASVGPIVESDFLMGELYDARREMPGWDRPGFDDSAWAPADVTEAIRAKVEAHPGPPVRAIAEFPVRAIHEPRPGVYVLDLGQNFAGFCRVRMKGRRGDVLQLRFAERLNPDGTIYTTNLRAARATDTYVFRGGGEVEEWQPRFTFHGFQFVEVTGRDAPPEPGEVVGVALSSDTPRVGSFECSEPMLEKLVSNIHWTQRANFIEVPTDCPQRDERLGWTGDAQVYVRTATLFCDVQAFFDKWLVDLFDAQRADGQLPMVAPLKVAGNDGGPGWADAGTICPWAIWEVYGDRRLLERHYEGMVRFVEFCEGRSRNGVLPPDKFHCFGDWVSVGADTPRTVIYTAYYAHSVDLVARAARVLGKEDDAKRFGELFERIKGAFVEEYVGPDGRILGDTQCAYVLALAFDLVEGTLFERAAEHLVGRIEARDGHLSTGFIGTKDLMLVLSKIGRDDIAFRLLLHDSYPSWGFSIRHGATSIWERWNGWTPEKGFMDPGMNSFAHYSFGAVGQWIFENVGGIRPAAPGYRKILIRPRTGAGISWARTVYEAVPGPIRTKWILAGDELEAQITIPANTTATVLIPVREGSAVTESGTPAGEAAGVSARGRRDGAAVFEIGSGTYVFRSGVDPARD